MSGDFPVADQGGRGTEALYSSRSLYRSSRRQGSRLSQWGTNSPPSYSDSISSMAGIPPCRGITGSVVKMPFTPSNSTATPVNF